MTNLYPGLRAVSDAAMVIQARDIESNFDSLAAAIPPQVLKSAMLVQMRLDEVASGGPDFHRLGVHKATAHRMIVALQREVTGVTFHFENVDAELLSTLQRKSRNDLLTELALLSTAIGESDPKAVAGTDAADVPRFKYRPSRMLHIGIQALDVQLNNPDWFRWRVAEYLGIHPDSQKLLVLMNNAERFLGSLGIPVNRPPEAGPTRG